MRLWLVLLVLLASPVLSMAGNVHTDCAGDTACELTIRDAEMTTGYDLATPSNCVHGPSASTTVAMAACQAYVPDGQYLTQAPMNITYSGGDGTYYLAGHSSLSQTAAGWQRVPGSHYIWFKTAPGGVRPDVPAEAVLLMVSTVATGAVTEALSALVLPPSGATHVNCTRYADASQPIQDAIDALPVLQGGLVILIGRCRITKEIVIARSSLTITGQAPSGRFRGPTDMDKSASAAHIEIGANLPGAVFRFAAVEGVSSQGNSLRNVTIFGGGDASSGRAYTVGTAAVFVESSDIFTLSNVRFVGIQGRALYLTRSVRSYLRDLDITLSGTPTLPCVEAGEDSGTGTVQGIHAVGISIEQCYGTYLLTRATSSRLHLTSVVMETAAAEPLTHLPFLDINGTNTHQFDSISLNNPRGTAPAVTVRNPGNLFTNFTVDGVMGGVVVKLEPTADANVWSGVRIAAAPAVAFDAFEVHSPLNVWSGVRLDRIGGLQFAVPGATLNQVSGLTHTSGNSYTIKDVSNGRNTFYGINASEGNTYAGVKVQLAADDVLVGGDLRSGVQLLQGIQALGDRGRIADVTIAAMPAAIGMVIQGHDWQITDNRIQTVGRACLQVIDVRPGVIRGNQLVECGTSAAGAYNGISLVNDTGVDIDTTAIITENMIKQGTVAHNASIWVSANGLAPRFTNMIIANNHIRQGGEVSIPPGNNNNWVANFSQAFNTQSSSATLTPPSYAGSLRVSGTTNITAITLRPPGPPLCLQFDDVLTIAESATVKLESPFTSSVDDTLCLLSNGTNWYELSRSHN